MQVTLSVLKVGSGHVDDETTGAKTPWAKLYGVSDDFVNDEMFTGFGETNFSIVDPVTKKPSIEIAKQISKKIFEHGPKTVFKMDFQVLLITAQKKQVLAICGLALPSAKAA